MTVVSPKEFYNESQEASESLELFLCDLHNDVSTVKLPECYSQYTDVFNENVDSTLPPHWGELDHVINLKPGSTAPFDPLYNLSEYELSVLKDYIEKNLKSGFIAQSKSSAGALILFIKKKDGTLCLCVDY